MPNENNKIASPGKILALLFLANLINFFDRTIPAILAEPIRLEWGLSDTQLGLVAAAFTVVYAIAGLPLGRLADTWVRTRILGWGLILWSGFTGLNALAWNYWSFFLMRMGVGIGEASYAPAANSLIGDLFPPERRAKAVGIFMLGLPLGLVLAFFTVGAMVEAFDSWRAPFLIAAVPGFLLAVVMFFIREPVRGASETVQMQDHAVAQPIRTLLRIPTLRWLILSGVTVNFASYAVSAFLVPLLQRYFALSLSQAAVTTGFIIGVTGLIGLTLGGMVADRFHRPGGRGRLLFGAVSLLVAAIGTGFALATGSQSVQLFALLFGLGWLAVYNYYTAVYPAIQDVVAPRLRATAMGLYFACMYLLGGAFGPLVIGALSDHFSHAAMVASGATEMTEAFKASGLHDALFLIPVALLLTAVFILLSSRHFVRDAGRMHLQQGE